MTAKNNNKTELDKYNRLGRLGIILFIISCIAILIIFALIYTGPKEVATAEQVWNAIIDAGYQPVDATELYADDMPNLVKCIGFEKDDEYFNFYILDSNSAASNLYANIASHINTHYYSLPYTEHTSAQSNYCIYTLKSSGRYSVDIYVENTVVYAYCDDEKGHNEGIVNVLKAIGYFN